MQPRPRTPLPSESRKRARFCADGKPHQWDFYRNIGPGGDYVCHLCGFQIAKYELKKWTDMPASDAEILLEQAMVKLAALGQPL